MKYIVSLAAMLMLFGGAQGQSPTTITYEETFENFGNPERGLPVRFDPPWPGPQEEIPWAFCETDESKYDWTEWTFPLDVNVLRQNREQGITLAMVRYHIADFRRREITPEFLERLVSDFSAARQAGVKLVPRFTYNWPNGGPDTSLEWVLTHLEQLRPFFAENYDVIAFCELGFIGCWGEGHTTANELMDLSRGYRRINDATQQIVEKFFEVLPRQRMIAVRYPEYKFQYFNGRQEDAIAENKPIAPLTLETAYDGSIRSRWGQHDDCYACGEWNAGTYRNPHSVANGKAPEVIDFLNADTEFTVQGGELGAGCCRIDSVKRGIDEDGDGYGDSLEYASCERIVPLFKKLRVTTLNYIEPKDSSRVNQWRAGECFEEIKRSVGYRFVLRQATLPSQLSATDTLALELEMSNVGWARPYNPRALEVVLRRSSDGQTYRLPLPAPQDERLWLPGPESTQTLSAEVALPAGISPGQYEVLLNMPDPHPNLRDNPSYSMRLANADVWEAETGYNALGATLTVAGKPESASGQITVRAKGDCGIETMELHVDGAVVKTWNNVATSFASYPYSGFTGGEVSVHFTNDSASDRDSTCSDGNLLVDYVTVCGVTYQTETSATETATCCLGVKDKLYTNGNFNFGSLSCANDENNDLKTVALPGGSVSVYPNPSSDELVVSGGPDYRVSLYDLTGRPVMQHDHLRGTVALDVSSLRPGVYLIKTQPREGASTQQRIIIQ